MLSKTSAMSVIAGVTMLVLPTSVFAGNYLRSNDGNLPARVAQVGSPQIELVKSHRGFHRVCDADGDDCRWVPNNIANNADSYYQCDPDGDDCRWVNGYGPRYWRDYGYDYGAPFS